MARLHPATRFAGLVGWLRRALLALWVFMADSIRALPEGLDTVRQVLPAAFNWPVFGAALLLMTMPLAHMGWSAVAFQLRRDRRSLWSRSISSASP
jgi:hypothetical protein